MLLELEDRCIELERPEKWVWYAQRYTILDLVKYYVAISPWLLPYLQDRPLVYEAYPGTIDGPHSFEQDPPARTPSWVKRTKIRGHERIVTYAIADSAATLAYLVSLFAVTLHVWESTTRDIERPDFLLLDLDPVGDCTIARLAKASLIARELLRENGMHDVLVKTSGARGLHVIAPLEPADDYKTVRARTHMLAKELARAEPRLFTVERVPQSRPDGTVYVDWGQMGRGMTIAAPFVPRACDGAPISMPLDWDEVESYARSRAKRPPIQEFRRYNIATAIDIVKAGGDPWRRTKRNRASAHLT